MEGVLNNAFKQTAGENETGYAEVGHYMPLVAELHPDFKSEYGSVWPHVGALLIINEDEQDWESPCNIEFEYDYAEISGWITGHSLGRSYDKKVWKKSDGATGYYSIPTGTRRFKQHLFTDNVNIYNIKNIESNDSVQSLRFYILGDDGIKLLYGMQNENSRDILDKTIRSWFVAPPKCVMCDGTGVYDLNVCPHCNGTKYIGYNAEGCLLKNKAKEVGVRKIEETQRSFQHRAWAKKQWVNPTVSGITNYVSLITGVPEDKIEISCSTGMKELKYYIRFPLGAGGTAALDEGGVAQSFIFDNELILQELLEDVSPAGTSPIVEPYYLLSDVSEMDYQNGWVSNIVIPMDNRKWYSKFTVNPSGIVNSGWITSGISGNQWNADGTGFTGYGYNQHMRFFNSETNWDSTDVFYTSFDPTIYNEIFVYDNAWVTAGVTGYCTGSEGEIFITGTTGFYRI